MHLVGCVTYQGGIEAVAGPVHIKLCVTYIQAFIIDITVHPATIYVSGYPAIIANVHADLGVVLHVVTIKIPDHPIRHIG